MSVVSRDPSAGPINGGTLIQVSPEHERRASKAVGRADQWRHAGPLSPEPERRAPRSVGRTDLRRHSDPGLGCSERQEPFAEIQVSGAGFEDHGGVVCVLRGPAVEPVIVPATLISSSELRCQTTVATAAAAGTEALSLAVTLNGQVGSSTK